LEHPRDDRIVVVVYVYDRAPDSVRVLVVVARELDALSCGGERRVPAG
jgi:hypothetical protein